MTVPFHQRPTFLRGRAGEQTVVRWLQERGWYVIPSYDYSGGNGDKAPRLQGIRDRFPVPDLDVARGGNRRWVEVKTKQSADWTRKTRQWEHGIEHYDDYVRVAEETGTEAWLAIFELDSGALLVQSFATLGEPRRSTYLGKRMAFWPRAVFRQVHNFRADELLIAANAGLDDNWREDDL